MKILLYLILCQWILSLSSQKALKLLELVCCGFLLYRW